MSIDKVAAVCCKETDDYFCEYSGGYQVIIMDFELLIKKEIINILDGDVNVFGTYALPYLSGPALCDLSTTFGLRKTYGKGGGNPSRWIYMQELLEFLNKQGRVGELLSYLMDLGRFTELNSIGDIEKVKETHKAIVEGAIESINTPGKSPPCGS